jgi:hypothetical protein
MPTPPPLPSASAIQHQIFYGQAAGGIRLTGGKYLVEKIEDAHQKAEAWLRTRPDLEVISISSGSASTGETVNAFFVTVWYRERS